MALTLPPAATGAQGSRAPLSAEKAARCGRGVPLDLLNVPPRYTVELVALIALTLASTWALKLVMTAPVVASSAAMRFLLTPLTVVKLPPM